MNKDSQRKYPFKISISQFRYMSLVSYERQSVEGAPAYDIQSSGDKSFLWKIAVLGNVESIIEAEGSFWRFRIGRVRNKISININNVN